MKKHMIRSMLWTSVGFIAIIIYCILSMINRFSYLDLAYLAVVVTCFILYLKSVKEL